jgi:hypothetical protein
MLKVKRTRNIFKISNTGAHIYQKSRKKLKDSAEHNYQFMVHFRLNMSYTNLSASFHKPQTLGIYRTRDFELRNQYVFDKH